MSMGLHVYALAGRRHAHELAFVGPVTKRAANNLVAGSSGFFGVEAQIGNAAIIIRKSCLVPSLFGSRPGICLMLDEAVSQSTQRLASTSPAFICSKKCRTLLRCPWFFPLMLSVAASIRHHTSPGAGEGWRRVPSSCLITDIMSMTGQLPVNR